MFAGCFNLSDAGARQRKPAKRTEVEVRQQVLSSDTLLDALNFIDRATLDDAVLVSRQYNAVVQRAQPLRTFTDATFTVLSRHSHSFENENGVRLVFRFSFETVEYEDGCEGGEYYSDRHVRFCRNEEGEDLSELTDSFFNHLRFCKIVHIEFDRITIGHKFAESLQRAAKHFTCHRLVIKPNVRLVDDIDPVKLFANFRAVNGPCEETVEFLRVCYKNNDRMLKALASRSFWDITVRQGRTTQAGILDFAFGLYPNGSGRRSLTVELTGALPAEFLGNLVKRREHRDGRPGRKPRLRSHHRDARWRGRREVHRFVDLLKKDVLDESSYSYARSFVGRDGQLRKSVGPKDPVPKALTRDPLGLPAFDVPFALWKKKRWQKVDEMRRDVEAFQDPDIALRASLVTVHSKERKEWSRASGTKEITTVDGNGAACRRQTRSTQYRQLRSCFPEHTSTESAKNEADLRPVHVVYGVTRFKVSKHQYNTAEKLIKPTVHETPKRSSKVQAVNQRGIRDDFYGESDEDVTLPSATTFPGSCESTMELSLADCVTAKCKREKRIKRKCRPISYMFEQEEAFASNEASSGLSEDANVPSSSTGNSTPVEEIPPLQSFTVSDELMEQLRLAAWSSLPVQPSATFVRIRSNEDDALIVKTGDVLVLRNAEDLQSARIYLNPAAEDRILEGPTKSTPTPANPSASVHNQLLPKNALLKVKRMSQADAEEKALDLLFSQHQDPQCTTECTFEGAPYCEVCFATDESGNGFALRDCGHYFCADCWRWGIAVGLHDNNLPVRCMAFDCKALLHPNTSLVVVPQTFAYRYRRMVVEQRQMRRDFATCTRCHSSLFIEGIFADAATTKGPRFVVCDCGQGTCADCGRSPHFPLSCQRLEEYEHTMQDNATAMELIFKPFMIRAGRCSGCGYLVIQTEGSCPHVHCRCGFEFCTNCERPWREHGNAGCTSKNAKRHEATEARLSYGSLPAAVFKNCSEWRLKASAGHKRKVLKHLKRLHGTEFANDAVNFYMELRQLVERSYAARYYRSMRANPRSDDAVGRRLNDLTEQLAFRLRQIEDSVVASTSKRNVEADNLNYAAEVAAKIIRMHNVCSQ